MARRHRHEEQELPFVALMDTMTNVVGVLTIVLVMMGISLARAASRVISSLPPATPEQLALAQKELDRLKAAQSPLAQKLAQLEKSPPTAAQLAALESEAAKLERSVGASAASIDFKALESQISKHEAELKQKKTAMAQLLEEQDKLKALLDATPVQVAEAPPAKVVRIPIAKPIPKDAEIELVLVTKESVHRLDLESAKAVFLREFKQATIRSTIAKEEKRGNKTVAIYDHQKLLKYFENRKLTDREFKIAVTFEGWTSSPVLVVSPRVASPAQPRILLAQIKQNPKAVAMFRVTGDGYENYLATREIADKIGLPAGWEAAGPEHKIHVGEIETNKPKDPPKPPPAAPAAGVTPPVQIKPPAKTLD